MDLRRAWSGPVFSDGVSEMNSRAGDIWNEDELEQVVAACAGLSACEAHRRIFDAAESFSVSVL